MNQANDRLRLSVFDRCTCGGSGPDDPGACPACLVWHDLREPEPSTPGQRIKAAREAAGLSQAELAKRVGVGPTTVSRWEAGLRGVGRHVRAAMVREIGTAGDRG